MKFKTLKFVAALLCSSALLANDYYEPKPFGDGKRAVVLEKLTTGKWWEKPAKNMRVTVDGKLSIGVTAKGVILAIIGMKHINKDFNGSINNS